MTLARQLRRARGRHRRTIPDGAAALIFTREPDGDADVLEVHYLHPKGAPTNGHTPEHAQLAMACAEYARELLTDEESDGTQTTGAEGAADDAGRSGAGGRDGQG